MNLKGRLKCIADMVPPCRLAADIGTDHAYVPVYLVQKGKCCSALACDVKPGPVEAAERNIIKFGLQGKIHTRLGDGLATLEKGEADVIIIAGMGGQLITEILSRDMDKARDASCLVLQPMNAIELVREWLNENGFIIDDEELASEGSKIYTIIRAHWTGRVERLQPIYYYIGKSLIEKKHPLLVKILERRINELTKALYELEKAGAGSQGTKDHYTWLKLQYEEIRNVLLEKGDDLDDH